MMRRLFLRQNKRNRYSKLETLEARNLLASDLVISEFLATNASSLRDDFREYSDWIELHNPTDEAVSVDGWYLTDDANDLSKWRFPSVEIPADGFLIVHASQQDVTDPAEELHTNFKLSSRGEFLALVRPDMTVSHSFEPEYPEQRVDVSYGLKFQDGEPLIGEGAYYTELSPGEANQGEGVVGFTDEVGFSVERGYYNDAFELTLETATPGATIRYTTDKTAPSPENGEIYSGPITIPTTTTLRAMAFTDDRLPSTTDTHTYIFLEDVLQQTGEGLPELWGFFDDQGNTRERASANYGVDPDIVNHDDYKDTIRDDLRSVPTISLVIDPDDLWSLEDGLYSNSMQKGDRWERPVSMEWLNTEGETEFQVNAGVRIHGGWARRLSQTKKFSFRINFKSEYGPDLLNHDVFPDGQQDSFQSLILRGGFNDSWRTSGNTDNTYAQDLWSRQAQRDLGGYASTDRYVHLYLNGLYWGMYSPTERMNAEWAAAYMGGEPDEWDVINTGGNVVDGNSRAFNELMSAVRADEVDYEYVKTILDVDEYIDYMIVNQYIGNWDWPHNNWYASRRRADGEKWRFHTWDAEAAFQRGITENRITLNNIRAGVIGPGEVYLGLLEFEEFRELFANKIYEHLFNDGQLSEQANIDRLNEITSEADRAIVGESLRWGDGKDDSGRPITRANWVRRINTINTTYFPRRADRLIGFYQDVGLFPEFFPPEFNQFGGNVSPDFDITLTTDLAGGDIYYTSDGSDPRGPDGLPGPSAIRLNTVDLVSDESQAKLLIPNGAASEANWQSKDFDDASWADSSAVIGFDSGEIDDPIAVPDGFTVTEYQSSERLNTVELADAVLAGENRDETKTVEGVPYLNFLEATTSSRRNGDFDGDLDFPIGGSNFVLDITGKIQVQQPGTYTFALTSDDYLRMELNGETLHADEGRHSTTTTLVTTELTAGLHDIHAVYYQRTSRAVLEFSFAPGVKTEFDEDFQIVGDIKHRPYGPIIKTDLADAMAGKNSSAYLRIPFEATNIDNVAGLFMRARSDDGFVAYLNGTQIASQNAPDTPTHNSSATAPKSDADAVAGDLLDLTEFKDALQEGSNVLAIHALNVDANDADFMLRPQLFTTLANAPINLENSATIKTRVNFEGDWSPLSVAEFSASSPATPDDIRISEIHYNPRGPSEAEVEAGFENRRDFEFVEVVNISDRTIDLSEVRFEKTPIEDTTEGLDFAFADGDILELGPGEFAVVVDDLDGFRFRYGNDIPVAGQWSGRLSNSSEKITLKVGDQTVHEFSYQDAWYPATDGLGASLEVFDPASAELANWGEAATWRPGSIDGTPGSSAEIQPGDVNGDGVFDSSDLVKVFQAGKYEDGIDNNATFEEGDWNNNGDFETSDLVFVFQLGAYVGDAPAAARSVDRSDLDREIFGKDLEFDAIEDDDFLNF